MTDGPRTTRHNRGLYEDSPWWASDEEPHKPLYAVLEKIRAAQSTRATNNQKLMNVYQYGYKASEYVEAAEPALADHLLSFPAIKQAVDTVWSKLIKAKIAPMPLASGGGYASRRKAKDLGKALQAEFDGNCWDRTKELVIKDALVTSYGAGCVKVYPAGTKVVIEHTPPESIIIDDLEGSNGNPRNYYQAVLMDRYVAIDRFGGPDRELIGSSQARTDAIMALSPQNNHYAQTTSDLVEIVEAWHLPSGPDAGDGLHVIACNGYTLFKEAWEHDSPPFAFYVPRRRVRGFWGISFTYDMASAQREFEKVGGKVQQAVQKMSGTHIIAARQANVTPDEISNEQGTFIEVDGSPDLVRVFNPDPFNQAVYQYWQSIPQMMMRYKGISETAAASQVPAGLQQASGKALQVFESFEDERLLPEHRELERLVVRVAELVIRSWKSILEEEPKYRAKSRERDTLRQYKISELMDGDEDPVISIFPVSELAKSPSAKFEQVTELLKIGAISVEQFRRLYDMPDIESETELDSADADIIDYTLERIVIDGEYSPPEPFDNLQLCISRARRFLNKCRRNDEDAETLALIHQYILDAKTLLEQTQPPPASAPTTGAPAGGPPIADPAAGPVPGDAAAAGAGVTPF